MEDFGLIASSCMLLSNVEANIQGYQSYDFVYHFSLLTLMGMESSRTVNPDVLVNYSIRPR